MSTPIFKKTFSKSQYLFEKVNSTPTDA